MNTDDAKEVRYDLYCNKCKHTKLEDYKDPCNECMEWPYREGTEVPLYFKDKESNK